MYSILQAHISEQTRAYKDRKAAAAMTCQTCGKRYRLRTTLSFTTAHLFSTNSFHAYLEFLTIFLTVGRVMHKQ